MDIALGVLIAVALIGANAFFVASEFALLSLDRSLLDTLGKPRRARLITKLLDKLTFHLSSAQFGITLTAVLLGFVMEPILARLFEPLVEPIVGDGVKVGVAIGVSLVIATGLHLVFGEQIPKMYAIARPLETTARLAPWLRGYSLVVGPITSALNLFAEKCVKWFGKTSTESLEQVESVADLEYFVKASEEGGTLETEDAELLSASLRFVGKDTADAFMPRTEVVAIGAGATASDLAELSVQTGFSRFPVVEADGDALDIDAVVGLVHVKKVFAVPMEERSKVKVADIASELFAVPLGLSLRELLSEMRRRRMLMAVVLDEHGGMAGIVTLENIVEILVGDIDDEHDEEHPQEVATNLIQGMARAEEVKEVTGFEMPEGEYETIAGYLLSEIKRIPSVGETIVLGGWTWEIQEMDGLRIAWIKFEAKPDADTEANAEPATETSADPPKPEAKPER